VRLDPGRRADSVSLRIEASDGDGNQIEQEVIRAFGVALH
jgi:hypothetical protein